MLEAVPASRKKTRQPNSQITSASRRTSALARYREPDDPDLIASRQDLAAAKASQYLRELVDSFPPITDGQRIRLAAILLSTAADA